ncbi:MAG TPA: dihydrofolate reductase family protein [Burkholderiaceae bacterium]
MQIPQVSVYCATSIDGYIARRDGALDWLDAANAVPNEDYGYAAFMDTVDTVLLGRGTYDKVLEMGWWPYAPRRVVVLTSRPLPRSPHAVETHDGPLKPLLARLGEQGSKRVYLDGGAAVRGGLREDVVDDMIVSVMPVLLGDGLPLFGPGTPELAWRSSSVRQYGEGLMQLRWERRR